MAFEIEYDISILPGKTHEFSMGKRKWRKKYKYKRAEG